MGWSIREWDSLQRSPGDSYKPWKFLQANCDMQLQWLQQSVQAQSSADDLNMFFIDQVVRALVIVRYTIYHIVSGEWLNCRIVSHSCYVPIFISYHRDLSLLLPYLCYQSASMVECEHGSIGCRYFCSATGNSNFQRGSYSWLTVVRWRGRSCYVENAPNTIYSVWLYPLKPLCA